MAELLNMLGRRPKSNLDLSAREALEQVLAHLEYQRLVYERLPTEERKGHIWEAVRVLKEQLSQDRRPEIKRQAGEPVRGY